LLLEYVKSLRKSVFNTYFYKIVLTSITKKRVEISGIKRESLFKKKLQVNIESLENNELEKLSSTLVDTGIGGDSKISVELDFIN